MSILDTQTLKKHPSGHPFFFSEEFLKHIIEFFHLHIFPMPSYKDTMPYFDKFIHVYGLNMNVLWSSLKIWTPKNFTLANFSHPISKSWLRPYSVYQVNTHLHLLCKRLPKSHYLDVTIHSYPISKPYTPHICYYISIPYTETILYLLGDATTLTCLLMLII